MKKITIILSMLFALTITAQNSPEIWMTYELKVKKGMQDKFENAVAKKMKKFNNSEDTAMFTFEIMDGENQGMYSRGHGWKTWDFLNSMDTRGEEMKYWNENVDPYIESQTGWKVWERLGWVSHNWTKETSFRFMTVQRRFMKPGMDQDIINFLRRMTVVYQDNNFTGTVGVFRVISGGNTNEYIICRGFDSYGDNGEFPDTDKNLEELYNEKFGWEAYRKDAKLYNDALEMYSRTTERYHFNEKLSTSTN